MVGPDLTYAEALGWDWASRFEYLCWRSSYDPPLLVSKNGAGFEDDEKAFWIRWIGYS